MAEDKKNHPHPAKATEEQVPTAGKDKEGAERNGSPSDGRYDVNTSQQSLRNNSSLTQENL